MEFEVPWGVCPLDREDWLKLLDQLVVLPTGARIHTEDGYILAKNPDGSFGPISDPDNHLTIDMLRGWTGDHQKPSILIEALESTG
jgi:hypothetical protein